ncbi:hypothetical protein BaRGS_00004202, partial [Batillaria attramentaria]
LSCKGKCNTTVGRRALYRLSLLNFASVLSSKEKRDDIVKTVSRSAVLMHVAGAFLNVASESSIPKKTATALLKLSRSALYWLVSQTAY